LTHALSPGGTLHLSGAPNLTEAVQGALLAKGSAVVWGVFSFHAAMFFCWEQIGLCWCKVIHMAADFLLVAVVSSLPGGRCGGSNNALICHICPKGWQNGTKLSRSLFVSCNITKYLEDMTKNSPT